MSLELIPITFQKVMQSHAYTVIILGTNAKQFAIYTEPSVGKTIQRSFSKEPLPRPFTHDLMQSIFNGFDIKPLKIVINNIEDTIYFARLYLEQQIGEKKIILEIDTRPSDCITLALQHQPTIPIFCKKEVFEKAPALTDL